MKFVDLDQNIVEAPEAYNAKQGFGKKLKAKVKSNTPFAPGVRDRAKAELKLRNTAKQIKNDFKMWLVKTEPSGTEPTLELFSEFIDSQMNDYAKFVKPVATKLKLTKVDKPKKSAQPVDNEKVDTVNPDEEHEDMISPEELTKESDEDVEETVDMSASIYESRLNYFMLLETKLKDNQLDTLIFRMVQAANKHGVKAKSTEKNTKTEPDKLRKSIPKGWDKDNDEEISMSSPKASKKSTNTLSDNEIGRVKDRLDELGEDIINVIRKQDGVDDSVKKKMINKIHILVVDMFENSF